MTKWYHINQVFDIIYLLIRFNHNPSGRKILFLLHYVPRLIRLSNVTQMLLLHILLQINGRLCSYLYQAEVFLLICQPNRWQCHLWLHQYPISSFYASFLSILLYLDTRFLLQLDVGCPIYPRPKIKNELIKYDTLSDGSDIFIRGKTLLGILT